MSIAATAPRARYLYAVVRSADARSARVAEPGLDGASVTAVTEGDLSVWVSPFAAARARTSRANLIAHQQVVEALRQYGTVLPVRFGTVTPDEDSVVTEFLEPNSGTFLRRLEELDGKVEFRVKVFYLPDVALREAVLGSTSLRRLRERIRANSSATTHHDQIELGELAVARLEEVKARDSARVLGRLQQYQTLTQVLSGTTENMALHVAILLDDTRTESLEATIDDLASEESERLRFELIGPLAPWDFVDLEVAEEAPTRFSVRH